MRSLQEIVALNVIAAIKEREDDYRRALVLRAIAEWDKRAAQQRKEA